MNGALPSREGGWESWIADRAGHEVALRDASKLRTPEQDLLRLSDSDLEVLSEVWVSSVTTAGSWSTPLHLPDGNPTSSRPIPTKSFSNCYPHNGSCRPQPTPTLDNTTRSGQAVRVRRSLPSPSFTSLLILPLLPTGPRTHGHATTLTFPRPSFPHPTPIIHTHYLAYRTSRTNTTQKCHARLEPHILPQSPARIGLHPLTPHTAHLPVPYGTPPSTLSPSATPNPPLHLPASLVSATPLTRPNPSRSPLSQVHL